MTTVYDELQSKLEGLPPKKFDEIVKAYQKSKEIWFPTVGPQYDAAICLADILLYGGQGGGGKTDLGLGLAFTQHLRSLILRRHYANLSGLIDRALEINGTRNGFNGSPPPRLKTRDNRLIQFAGCQHLGDEQDFQGIPFDLKVFDEACQFLELQVRFHLGWIRSVNPDQRNRALLATNPPVDADGDWLIRMFRPWLDITYHKPAKPGELRWFITDEAGHDVEVDGPEKVQRDGQEFEPKSRSFIPAALGDNPYLVRTGYKATLDALPEPLRSAVRDGNFMAARQDADFQVIPTDWVIQAQQRWTSDGHRRSPMTAMGYDPAGGGNDAAELAIRHGGWFAEPETVQGEETADGSSCAAFILKRRRNNAAIVVDVGGGYGGQVTLRLKDNGVSYVAFNGAGAPSGRTVDGNLRFANKRAEAWWRFREALDPDQQGGSVIALPPNPELRSDLTAPIYSIGPRGILIESKDDLRKRLGRSTGKGDAAVMSLSEGDAAIRRGLNVARKDNLPQYAKVRSGPLTRHNRRRG